MKPPGADPSARPSAYDKALALLAMRTHFHRELRAKLAQRGYPEEEIAAALDRLAAEGYLDDHRAAAELVAGRLSRGSEGRRRLAAELARRGAGAEVAAAALAALPEDDTEAAREAAERWAARGGRAADRAGALARHLDRKGFSRRAIVAVLRDRGDRGGEGETGLEEIQDVPED